MRGERLHGLFCGNMRYVNNACGFFVITLLFYTFNTIENIKVEKPKTKCLSPLTPISNLSCNLPKFMEKRLRR